MKVVIISSGDTGGAGIAAYRLFKGLKRENIDISMIVSKKSHSDSNLFEIRKKEDESKHEMIWQYINFHGIENNYTTRMHTQFNVPYRSNSIHMLPILKQADIINLHWIANYMTVNDVKNILNLGKPVVWTLHDMWPFTGGCHYSNGCNRFMQECEYCPQLKDQSYNLTECLLKDKISLWKSHKITIISPSRWLAKNARKSILFNDSKIEVIPYGIDIDIFKPIKKNILREKYKISSSSTVILIGNADNSERRKGILYSLKALEKCLTFPRFEKLAKENRIVLLTVGKKDFISNTIRSKMQVISAGFLKNEKNMAELYGISDIFLLSSLEDNLPNTVMEAMSCGICVIAFKVGGIPDMIIHNKNGLLAKCKDVNIFADYICEMVLNQDKRIELSVNARKTVEDFFPESHQAEKYLNLFKSLKAKRIVKSKKLEESSLDNLENKISKLMLNKAKQIFDKKISKIEFSQIIELNKNNVSKELINKIYNLGKKYFIENKKNKAVNCFKYIYKLKNTKITQKAYSNYYLGEVSNDVNNKIRYFKQTLLELNSIKRKNSHEVYLQASVLKRLNDNNAILYFKKVLRSRCQNNIKASTYFHIGEIYFYEKKWREAIQAFKKCLALKPLHAKARKILAKIV